MPIYKVVEQELYQKAFKKLSKSYRHIGIDVDNFLNSINTKQDNQMYIKLE